MIPPHKDIRDHTPEGQATRDNFARIADIEARKNRTVGAELGYRYVDPPIIDNIPGGPECLIREYHPTTWPGARLPHVWLADGTPMQDRIPDDSFTLLRLGNSKADTSNIEGALKSRGAPLTVLDIPDAAPRDIYGFDLILLRPDMHIVWRGNTGPADAVALAATATGH